MEPFHNNPTKFKTCSHCKSEICKEKNACLLKSARGVKENIQKLSGIFDAMITLSKEGDTIAQRSGPMTVTRKRDGKTISTTKTEPTGVNIKRGEKKKTESVLPPEYDDKKAEKFLRHKKAKKREKAIEGSDTPRTKNPRGPDKTGKTRAKTPKQPPIRVKQTNPLMEDAVVTIKKKPKGKGGKKKTLVQGGKARVKADNFDDALRVLKRHGGMNKERAKRLLEEKGGIQKAMEAIRKKARRR